jgi:hypothetical protein
VRLDLFAGEGWIEVKKELSYGEQQRLAGGGLGKMSTSGAEIGLDLERYAVERMMIWIVDWSLQDAKGKPVKITRDAVSNLAQDVSAEIDRVLGEHIAAIEAASAEKNATKAK